MSRLNSFGSLRRGLIFMSSLIGTLGGAWFAIAIWGLFEQLDILFQRQDQFVPTRIYSDVTRISSGMRWKGVEDRLKALGYLPTGSSDEMTVQLHSMDYPSYLIPDRHPQHAWIGREGERVELSLKLSEKSAQPQVVRQISLNGTPVSDAFLEPEFVSTFPVGSQLFAENKSIRTALAFDKIPANVWKAIMSVEDQHFLDHKGLDPKGLLRAIWVNLRTRSFAQGGSTITQQLVKNLMARRGKNVLQKANEAFLSLVLEARYDKLAILERYLNEVYLGQVGNYEVHGVAEGAELFFGKKIERLELAEVALLAALIRGPGFYSPYRHRERALERQRLVLKKMVDTGQIASDEMQEALQTTLRFAQPQAVNGKAPYFVDYVKHQLLEHFRGKLDEEGIARAGFRVYTTLDLGLNLSAQKSIAELVPTIEQRQKIAAPLRLEGALASVEHGSGELRALVGGRNYTQSNFNRILNMKRQVGSTFKPIVYLAALKKRTDEAGVVYTGAYPVEDAPLKVIYDQGRQEWQPKNYEKGYQGWMTLRKALAHSINTCAARIGGEVGIGPVLSLARTLGIETEIPKVPSVFLGIAELSLLEVLKVFSTLASGGHQGDFLAIKGITEKNGSEVVRFHYRTQDVISSELSDAMRDLLEAVFTEGTAKGARALGFTRRAFGKTGTTSHHRDAWFAGSSQHLTTVVWLGLDAFSTDRLKKAGFSLTGANSALPVWTHFMKEALDATPSESPDQIGNRIDQRFDKHSGLPATPECPDSQVVLEKVTKDFDLAKKGCLPHWPPSLVEKVLKE